MFFKIGSLRPETLLKETPTQVFSCEYYEIFKNSFSYVAPLGPASVKFRTFEVSGICPGGKPTKT